MQKRVLKSWPCPGTRVSSLIFLVFHHWCVKNRQDTTKSTNQKRWYQTFWDFPNFGDWEKNCGVPWGKLDLYKPFFKTQAYKMIGFGAWELTWGNHFVRSRFLIFLGFTGVCWGITPSLVPSPFCKPLTMDVCKVNSWVPYKMVALGQGGKCAGG